MSDAINHFISPNFTHQKLEPPFYKDVVDVFEDRMTYWLLMPAKKLLNIQHGYVAAIALATNYIEGIEIYFSGKDSEGKSRKFFRRGFKRIFTVDGPLYLQDSVADSLYDLLRCGFAHDAMFRNRIYFSEAKEEAITVTWPRINGELDPNGQLESAIINPRRFIECIELHFKNYVQELRIIKSTPVKEKFKEAVKLKWQLDGPSPFIGMTEEEFLKKT